MRCGACQPPIPLLYGLGTQDLGGAGVKSTGAALVSGWSTPGLTPQSCQQHRSLFVFPLNMLVGFAGHGLGQLNVLLRQGMPPFDFNLQWGVGLVSLPYPSCKDWGHRTLVVHVWCPQELQFVSGQTPGLPPQSCQLLLPDLAFGFRSVGGTLTAEMRAQQPLQSLSPSLPTAAAEAEGEGDKLG